MGYLDAWKGMSHRQLNLAIQAFSLISIFFEGYDQGVMGGVNASPDYLQEVGLHSGVMPNGRPWYGTLVNSAVHQGGIVSIYYLGCIVGCFAGGYLADRIGRINGIWVATWFALIGGALQCATQSSAFILVARVVTGLGTGALTGITPVLVAETSTAGHRGGYLGYVFIANYLGISVAYWLDFGLAFIHNGNSAFRWRFLLGFQCIPALLLLIGIKLLPDSPRFLASVGRYDEAREVIEKTRGNYDSEVETEFLEICAVAKESVPTTPLTFVKILFGRGGKPGSHLGRRAWLCLWLQIMASWTGITAVTAYSPVLLRAAGFSQLTQNGLAGGINTIGIIGTIISAQIVDKLGRRLCLMGGSFSLFAVNIIAASLYEASRDESHPNLTGLASGAVAMLFLFNLFYAATWGTVAFLIPTEIWSSEMRATGNGFGITGWAIGVGWTVLVNPIMFANLGSRTYYLFAGLNVLWIPIVYFFYPETAHRSLESIDALFSTPSPFNSSMEAAYRAHGDVLAEKGIPDDIEETHEDFMEKRSASMAEQGRQM